ncbi:hypothetical protein WR25_22917 [Diploscapter pachys]|uniref:Uncharacterized protein n=1 Tax=Diploscapter pachys TaxID=2018661 RepID=A0A2A2L2Q5_9BILA|nr:hypothetical protein WR25_22917 [Diploscapter pachys]
MVELGVSAMDLPPLGNKIVFSSSPNSENIEDPKKIANYRCNCKYTWLREMHGMTAVMMSNSLEEKAFWYSVIIFCSAISIYNTTLILGNYTEHQTATLITFIPVKSLKYPTLVFCPKNPDFLHLEPIYQDLNSRVPNLDNTTRDDVIRYAIGGMVFDNVVIENFTKTVLV